MMYGSDAIAVRGSAVATAFMITVCSCFNEAVAFEFALAICSSVTMLGAGEDVGFNRP